MALLWGVLAAVLVVLVVLAVLLAVLAQPVLVQPILAQPSKGQPGLAQPSTSPSPSLATERAAQHNGSQRSRSKHGVQRKQSQNSTTFKLTLRAKVFLKNAKGTTTTSKRGPRAIAKQTNTCQTKQRTHVLGIHSNS